MKTETIRLFMPERPGFPESRPEVAAIVIGGMALHRKADRDGTELAPRQWTLTHVATGSSVNKLLPQGRACEGKASQAAYVAFMREVTGWAVWRAWQAIMGVAPFGTESPAKMGGYCVDLSRALLADTQALGALFAVRARS